MFQSFLENVIAYCLNQLKGERTVYSVYHILTGKKTSQTIQDIHLYRLGPLFRTCPDLDRPSFDQIIDQLQEREYITVSEEKGQYGLTAKGQRFFETASGTLKQLSYLDGFKYHSGGAVFWKRLSLLFQVISNAVHKNNRYLAIQRDSLVQKWLKQYLAIQKLSSAELASRLYEELLEVLECMEEPNSTVLMLKLSGYHRAGYSNKQISSMTALDEWLIHFVALDAIHGILSITSADPIRYPLLSSILKENENIHSSTLTKSSRQTLQYLVNGSTVEQIVSMRNLKQNTIEDHIVEIAIQVPDFDITPYVSERELDLVCEVIRQYNTNQLKTIKRHLPDDISFFQIRLALARGGG
ncbi:MAG: helix-turn-helix domain-containing protein [Bacillus sp. (in: firmicutes)]